MARLAKQLEGEHLDSSKRLSRNAAGRQPCGPLLDLSFNRSPLACQNDPEPSPLVPATAHIKRRFFSPSPLVQRPDMNNWLNEDSSATADKENMGQWPVQLMEAQSPCINPKRKLYGQQSGGSPKLTRRASKRRCSMFRSMPDVLPAAMAPPLQPLSMSADAVLLQSHLDGEQVSQSDELSSLTGRGWPGSPQPCSSPQVPECRQVQQQWSTPGTSCLGIQAMDQSPEPTKAAYLAEQRRRSFSPLDVGPASALPMVENAEIGLPSVSAGTVADLLQGGSSQFGMDEYRLVDCRYWYEHQGGHIPGALNMTDPEAGEALTFGSNGALDGGRTAVILYCEFSSERAPRMFRHLRNLDRKMHLANYPALDFPHLYVLKGGYKAFWKRYPHLCTPHGSYTRMGDPAHSAHLKQCHASARASWATKKGVRKM
ncbi:hypothetical protein WJX72_009085 [[Myrmecia] bisecta]|uniref:protein-tyrosine-phosphatase n=1 Tax=[Myrmecia] bisecta TaxID=41462 RepID=A0AAW1PXU9_9CHLO